MQASRQRFNAACNAMQSRLWPSQRACRRRAPRGPPRSNLVGRALPLEDAELRQLLGQGYLRPEYDEYSDEHVDDLVEAAAGLISVIDDLRPLDADSFNAFYEIYKGIAAVPPADRVRILDELEPGALFSLWRASLGQYVLDEGRKGELFEQHIIWDDFPTQSGQVVEFEGLCEQFKYEPPPAINPAQDVRRRAADPRLRPWLKASPAAMATPQERFKQLFFVANRTGLLHGRMVMDTGPLAALLSPPSYCRVEVGLTLLPSGADAGADACLVYPYDPALLQQKQAAGVALTQEDLPSKLWPPPAATAGWSPMSFGERDYLRVAGPGVYVGCAYRRNEKGDLMDEEHVYFALVRTSY